MAGLTGLSTLTLATKADIDATIYMDPEANYLYSRAASHKTLGDGNGDTKRFQKYALPEAFTTPLVETELDPTPQVLSKTFIDAQIDYYGTYYLITERSVKQNPEDVLRVAAGNLNAALRKTEDILARNILLTTTTNIACVSGENGDRPTEITAKDLSTVISTLVGLQAKPISKQINASGNFGTAPVAQAYLGVFHPDLIPDFEAIPDFKTIDQYGSVFTPYEAEWGAYSRSRWMQTTQSPKESAKSALGKSVYGNFLMGANAFSIIKQEQSNGEIVGPNKVGALKDKYEYGIKTSFAGALLFDQHVANVTATRSTELV